MAAGSVFFFAEGEGAEGGRGRDAPVRKHIGEIEQWISHRTTHVFILTAPASWNGCGIPSREWVA